jgi:hypothetical protein
MVVLPIDSCNLVVGPINAEHKAGSGKVLAEGHGADNLIERKQGPDLVGTHGGVRDRDQALSSAREREANPNLLSLFRCRVGPGKSVELVLRRVGSGRTSLPPM